ncbi:hypothetical protein [Acinetobacter sp. Marseille-Q1618]|uniref:A1S_2505 family phage non-structural protein n=1 Tax=Acinetobacter sp. Marseille-Q1618 TaxID=2697502 RepID=UPI00156F2A4D|nr:hypothetical protein [Acinetobacter sp. Marseille-Q1618]
MYYQYFHEIKDYHFSDHQILVFGCHELGKHYSGYTQTALHHFGAVLGQGEGRQGQSYGIPTIAENGQVLDLNAIENYIENFKKYAVQHAHLQFMMTEIGCGFAKYHVDQIAPLFLNAPKNIHFPFSFMPFLEQLPIFRIENIELLWKADECYLELPLDYAVVARLAFKQTDQLINLPNIWEKYPSTSQQYLKLDEQQFVQLHHAIEKFKQDEATLFAGLI